jgi:hypothetical protein
VEVPELGLVTITFSKQRSQHHKSVRWFWSPESAELVEHVCDRKGKSTKVVIEGVDATVDAIYPTCSVCGKPQVRLSNEAP